VIADENWPPGATRDVRSADALRPWWVPPLFDRTAAMAVLYAFLSRRFNLKQLY
jgi:hypothetical protein